MTDDMTVRVMQCGSCDFWHVSFSWPPSCAHVVFDEPDGSTSFVAEQVFDTDADAIEWADQQIALERELMENIH